MPISVTCPGCSSVYPVPETLIGKSIRCKRCDEMIPVEALAHERPTDAPRAARVVRRAKSDDDDDDDNWRPGQTAARGENRERPRKSNRSPVPRKTSPLPFILAGGCFFLLMNVGIAVALIFTGVLNFGGNDDDQANNAPNPAPVITKPEPEPTPEPEPPSKPKPPPATKTSLRGPEPPSLPPPFQRPTPPPVVTPNPTMPPPINNERLMSGVMNAQATDLVTRATVLIEVEMNSGMRATGSGWFGIESNLIFTNAHVLDMKAPDARPPAKITVHLYRQDANGGARVALERSIPHSRLRVIAVDREQDLALIEVLNERDLPAPLQVRASNQLRVRQGISVLGFPLTGALRAVGEIGKDKQPEMSVRPSTVTALRADDFGRLKYVQVEGGMDPGNSGGPVVDAEGHVVAVTVAGVLNRGEKTQIGLGVPTEYVLGLLAGRGDRVEYDQAYRADGKVRIPVTVRCLDPFHRLSKVSIATWIGDATGRSRSPGTNRPAPLASDAERQEVSLKYDAEKKLATGELEFPDLTPGRAYWAQPFYTSSAQPEGYWMPGSPIKLSGPPVERNPINLTAKLTIGSVRSLELSNTSDVSEYVEGEKQESKNERLMMTTKMTMTESTLPADKTTGGAARLHFKYQSLELAAQMGSGGEQSSAPKSLLAQLNQNINRVEGVALVNLRGEITRSQTIANIPEPRMAVLLGRFSDSVMESLMAASIPLPNRQVAAGETWETRKPMRMIVGLSAGPGPNDDMPPMPMVTQPRSREYRYEQRLTFTYLGVRDRGGKQEAVVRINGKVAPSSSGAAGVTTTATGEVSGLALLEIGTGAVLEADISSEFEIDTSASGLRKKLSALNQYKLVRGASAR